MCAVVRQLMGGSLPFMRLEVKYCSKCACRGRIWCYQPLVGCLFRASASLQRVSSCAPPLEHLVTHPSPLPLTLPFCLARPFSHRLGIDSIDKLRSKLGEMRAELQDAHRFQEVYNYSFQWACEVCLRTGHWGSGGREGSTLGPRRDRGSDQDWDTWCFETAAAFGAPGATASALPRPGLSSAHHAQLAQPRQGWPHKSHFRT